MPRRRLKIKDKKTFKSFLVIVGIFMIAGLILFAVKSAGSEEAGIGKPAIALIPMYGEIMPGGAIDPTVYTNLIKEADEAYSTRAIILEINSPGGTVVASKEIADAVKNTKKPTVAWIREVGASGAYWIASAADKIVADEASITGSIGVTGSYLQFSELFEDYGITYERLVSGTYKDTGSPFKNLSELERSYLQAKIDRINIFFIDAIAENRNMDASTVNALANGQIFLGIEAKEAGLVDVLGGKEEARKTAEELAGLKSSKLVRHAPSLSILDLMGAKISSFAYWIGQGIGASLDPTNKNTDALMAELY